ncbi:MAG: LptF/LptG family permease [Kiritimatiellia bacterium]
MTILFRYVLKEFLKPLFYCMTGFLGIYIIFELFESFNRILENKPSVWQISEFFIGYVSPYLQWIIPAALMLATLYTMWNFCRHSEISAMRASGIGFAVIVSPLFMIASILTVAVALINEFYAPDASEKANAFRDARFKEITTDIKEDIPYYNPAGNRVWRIKKIDAKKPGVLEGVHISFDRLDGSSRLDITCRKAEYLDGMWWLFYPQYQYFDELNNPVENPHPDLAMLVIRAFPWLTEKPQDFILMNKAWEYYNIRDLRRYLREHPNLSKEDVAAMRYDIHSKMAIPLSCLIITLFAIPAGVTTSRQGVFKGVIIAISMFLGFYACNMIFMFLAKNSLFSAISAAWLPNIAFLIVGLVLFHRQR